MKANTRKTLRWVVGIGLAIVIFYAGLKPLGADIKATWEKLIEPAATEQVEE